MAPTTDPITDAMTLEADSADGVEAAVGESRRGSSAFPISLLIEAVEKERESLDAIELAMDSLHLSLEQRRRAIYQQDEMLRELSNSLNVQGR